MTCRLRRMLLINTKTSGAACSGAISEIDPRGGAAITGKNGVGKTTTLQLVPLFFGHSPSQIAQTGGTREPMLRFVLPEPQCAIAFEYQRGDNETDIRLVVLRRQDNSDAPEYRFFESGFKKELFIQPLSDGSGSVFLDDDGTVENAAQLHIASSPRLTASQYRSVILNLRSFNKDSDLILKNARRFSFSHKQLHHMDRLVASVVKEHVDFRDFTAVAVTMVFEQMGGLKGLNEPGQKLLVRQGKDQIERWLKNRDACERALNLKDAIEELRSLLGDFRQHTLAFRQLRGDLRQVAALLAQGTEEQKSKRTALEASHRLETERLQELYANLQTATEIVANSYLVAKNCFDDENSKKEHFAENDAKSWAVKVNGLPLLNDQRSQTQKQMEDMGKVADGISRKFDAEISDVETKTAQTSLKMQGAKKKHDDAYQSEIDLLSSQEEESSQVLQAEQESALEQQREIQSDLDEKLGEARAAVSNPSIDPKFSQAIELTQTQLNDHNSSLQLAQEKQFSAMQEKMQAKTHFEKSEATLQSRREAFDRDVAELEKVQLTLIPPKGSFHEALLQSSDNSWRSNLAKIIAPELLTRLDLSPSHTEEGGVGIYGWNLDLSAIGPPGWSNDEAVKQELSDWNQRIANAQIALNTATQSLSAASDRLDAATSAHNEAEAIFKVLRDKSTSYREALQFAHEASKGAIQAAAFQAQKKLEAIRAQTKSQKSALEELTQAFNNRSKALRDEFRVARESALQRRNNSNQEIDSQVATYQGEQRQRIKQLEGERDRELEGAGVDTHRLNGLRAELGLLDTSISAINAHVPLVRAWEGWMHSNGPTRLVALQIESERLAVDRTNSQEALLAHEKAMRSAQTNFNISHQAIGAVLNKLETDCTSLQSIEMQLEEYTPLPGAGVTHDTTAADLKFRFSEISTKRQELNRKLESKYKNIDQKLTSQESAVKEFISLSLKDLGNEASVFQRAERLAAAYDRIGREVTSTVNSELSTILMHISQFRSRIQTFETEVKSFNRKLQDGLNRVVLGFERLKDFKISVVTDFEQLDFMGKLKLLDEVVLQHRDTPRAAYSFTVPPASSAYALQDFMSVLSNGTLEVDLAQHITLSGSVNDNGIIKVFRRGSELESLSSTGLTAIALITLLSGMLNVIRGSEPIYIPWVTDEVGRFDSGNFQTLMQMLRENHIDVVTASPSLTPAGYEHFSHRYLFGERGSIAVYADTRIPKITSSQTEAA
jgi:hypothetical protein